MRPSLQRGLKLSDRGSVLNVTVDIVWPEQRGSSWFADWCVTWPDRRSRGSTGGIDGIQALLGALMAVGVNLNCSAEHDAKRLSWIDDWLGYGFPVPGNLRDALIGDDARYL